jgi:hypothetical protein
MVRVLAIGRKIGEFKSGRGRYIFKGNKNPLYDFLLREGIAITPCRKILLHVKEPPSMKEIIS